MTTEFFRDDFTGSGDLSTHSPDVGGAYTLGTYGAPGSTLADMALNGSGGLLIPINNAAPDAKSEFTVTGTSWAINLVANTIQPTGGSLGGASIWVYLENTAANAGVMLLFYGDTLSDTAQVYMWVYDNSGILFDGTDTAAIVDTSGGEHSYKLNVTPTGCQLIIDGVTQQSTAAIPGIEPDALHLVVNGESDTSVGYISSLTVTDDVGGGAPSNRLIKTAKVVVDPGSPGYPAIPGKAAWTERIAHKVWKIIGYKPPGAPPDATVFSFITDGDLGSGYWVIPNRSVSGLRDPRYIIWSTDPKVKPFPDAIWVPPGYYIDDNGTLHKIEVSGTNAQPNSPPVTQLVPIYGWVDEYTTVEHPAVPGRPAIPARDPVYQTSTGWTGSAVSIAVLHGDGALSWEVPTDAVGVVVGFNSYNTGSNYPEISHGFMCARGKYNVIEHGVAMTTPSTYTDGQRFKISRTGTTVTYYVDSTLVYTSGLACGGTVFADCSLFLGNDSISNARWTGATPVVPLEESVRAIGGIGLAGVAGQGASYVDASGKIGLAPAPDPRTFVDGNIGLYGVSSAALLTFDFALSQNEITLFGYSYGNAFKPNTLNGSIALAGNSSAVTNPNGYVWVAGEVPVYGAAVDDSFYLLLAYCSGQFFAQDTYSLVGWGTVEYTVYQNGFDRTLSGYSFAGYSGGAAWLTPLGAMTGSASGTVVALGRITATLPRGVLAAYGGGSAKLAFTAPLSGTATGTVEATGGVQTYLPTLTGVSYGGGAAALQGSGYAITATGTVVANGTVAGTLGALTGVGYGGGYADTYPVEAYTATATGTAVILGSADATLPPPAIAGYSGAAGDAVLSGYALTATGTAVILGSADATLPLPALTIYSGGYADASTTAPYALVISATTELVAKLDATLPLPGIAGYSGAALDAALSGYALAATGSVIELASADALLPLPTLTIYSGGGADALLPLPVLTVAATTIVTAQADALLPLPQLAAYSGGTAVATLGGYALTATGSTVVLASADALLPLPALVAYVGGYADSAYPGGYALTATASTVALGRADATMPAPTLLASGSADLMASLAGEHSGEYALDAYAGAAGQLEAPAAVLTATGTVDWLARCVGEFYALTITASGSVEYLGRCDGVLPALQVSNVGLIIATLPHATLRAWGSTGVSVEYEAYSLTLMDDGVAATRYTTFPFDRIVRWQDKYYGVASDGLYELDGDDFDGTPIVATVQTAETDFGHPGFKRFPSLYFNGRVGADFDVAIMTAEADTYEYVGYRPVIKPETGTHRVIFGKGIRAHYASYKFTNPAGEDFTIDSLAPQIDPLRRQV